MHYYQFNIGDYRKDTGHLTPIEHYIYRTLIDWYYLDEKPIPDIPAILRKLGLANDRSTDVQQVLNDFFQPLNGVWKHQRIDVEIQAYHRLIEDASKAGKASAIARKAKKLAALERPFNQPITNNHKPITNNQEILKTKPLCLDDAPSIKNVASSIKTPKGSRLNKEWVLPADWGNWALEQNPAWGNSKVESIADGFRDYWISVAGAKGVKADWEATWRNWIRRQNESYLSSGS